MAPHLTNPGLYTNRDNEPHENFVYQNLRSSRMENSQRDVLGERIRLLAHQLDISQVGDSVRSPDVPNQEDSNSMPALPNHNWAAGPPSGSEQNVSIRMDQSHVMANDQSETNCDELILIKPLDKKVIDERSRKVKKCGNSEQQWYATERHKTPLVDLTEPDQPIRLQKTKKRVMTVQDLEDDPMDEPDTIQSDHSIQGSDSEWNEPGNRPPPSANKRRPYRHVPSPTHYRRRRRRKKKRNESEASTQETLDSSSRADSDGDDSSDDDSSDDRSDDSSDEAEDTEEVDTSFENAQPGPSRSKPVRSSNRTPQKKSRIINSSVDEDDEDDDDDSSEEPEVKQSLSRRISRDRKTPLKNSKRNSSKTINTAKRNLNNEPSSSRIPTFQIESDSFMDAHESADCSNAELDGVSWIKHLTSLRTPFIPQINDEVFYSPGAHAKYCEEFEKKVGRLRVNERVPKEINKQNLMERLILCDVSSIEGML